MAKIEIQSLRTPTKVTGIPEHPEPLIIPSGRALVLDTEIGEGTEPPTRPTPTEPGTIVFPREKRGKVVLLGSQDVIELSVDELVKCTLVESHRAWLGVHDTEKLDVDTLMPLARRVDQAGLELVIQVGEPDG